MTKPVHVVKALVKNPKVIIIWNTVLADFAKPVILMLYIYVCFILLLRPTSSIVILQVLLFMHGIWLELTLY